jgi:hypothetical protein
VKNCPHPFEKSPDSAYVSVKEAPFPGIIHIHDFDLMNLLPISEIQEVVDALVDVTLSAMNEETRGWVQSWLHESMIPLLGEKQG